MIDPRFYPPTNRQRLRAWYRRQQRPTPRSASRIVVVVRPRLTATGAGIVALTALGGACLLIGACGYVAGWFGLVGVGGFAWAWSFYVEQT